MSRKALYSDILQDFARPLLNSKDTDNDFMSKMKMIEIIWNYSIAKKIKMPVLDVLEKIIAKQTEMFPEMKEVFDKFLELKKTDFDHFNNYITGIGLRENKDGSKIFYVESVDLLKNKIAISKNK